MKSLSCHSYRHFGHTHKHTQTYGQGCVSTFMFIYIGNFRSNQAKRRVTALTQKA